MLIFGETGTGKELVARLIHNRSPRQAGPFIRVNCGAIPPELIDSQLFGHERGAFTGAVETRPGWFERADGGTLLLDEMGELPLAAQVRLLRILQDGWLERVGGQKPINVDVRIVAATHRDLAAMVAEGKFREDLWYRIAVFPIVLPPLRERREDIPALAAHFAQRAATRFGLPAGDADAPKTSRLLRTYAWPGNIRELAAVIDRAAIIGNGRRLEVAKALGVGTIAPASANSNGQAAVSATVSSPEILPLDDAMKQHIEAALRHTRGRIEGPYGAARLLQINPHTLRRGCENSGSRGDDSGRTTRCDGPGPPIGRPDVCATVRGVAPSPSRRGSDRMTSRSVVPYLPRRPKAVMGQTIRSDCEHAAIQQCRSPEQSICCLMLISHCYDRRWAIDRCRRGEEQIGTRTMAMESDCRRIMRQTNCLPIAVSAAAKFFRTSSPSVLRLERGGPLNNGRAMVPPTYEIDARSIFQPDLEERDRTRSAMSGPAFRLVVAAWLAGLTRSGEMSMKELVDTSRVG